MSELPSVTNCTDIDIMLSVEKLRSVPNLQQFKDLNSICLERHHEDGWTFAKFQSALRKQASHDSAYKHPVTDMLIRLYHEREGHS